MQLSFRNHDSERLQRAGNTMALLGMMRRERVTQTGVRIDSIGGHCRICGNCRGNDE